jgi:hypothetical protein
MFNTEKIEIIQSIIKMISEFVSEYHQAVLNFVLWCAGVVLFIFNSFFPPSFQVPKIAFSDYFSAFLRLPNIPFHLLAACF